MAENWSRLAKFIRFQRDELRLTQSQVQEKGGPSPSLQRTIENDTAKALSRPKRRDYERALKWARGSIDDILDGKDPRPLSESAEMPSLRTRPDVAPDAIEIARELRGFEPLKLFGLVVAANALSDAADDLAKGAGDAERVAALAQKTYHATMVLLAETLGVEEAEARETARQLGYIIEDLGIEGSARQ